MQFGNKQKFHSLFVNVYYFDFICMNICAKILKYDKEIHSIHHSISKTNEYSTIRPKTFLNFRPNDLLMIYYSAC